MKETFYFSHDYNARNDQKILTIRGEYGLEGYALFFMILETMAEEDRGYIYRGAIAGLGVSYSVTKEKLLALVEKCIEIGLLYEDEIGIFSKRMMDHKKYRQALSEQGKKGAEKRWKNSPPNSPPNAKERKGKERKENIIISKDIILKDNIENDLFRETLGKFIEYRKRMKKPIGEESKDAFISKLENLSGNNQDTAIQIMNESMANGWQGIFALKQDSSKKSRVVKFNNS